MNKNDENVVVACADLVGRAGARSFEIGHIHENVPADEAGWYAVAYYQGGRIQTDEHRSPILACMALAERLLSRGTCRCRRPVTLSDSRPGCCRWRLIGARWEPSCDVPSLTVPPGDYAAMKRALAQPMSRRDRRARW